MTRNGRSALAWRSWMRWCRSTPRSPLATGTRLSVRIGMHTGPVVIGDGVEVFGETANSAARALGMTTTKVDQLDTALAELGTLRGFPLR